LEGKANLTQDFYEQVGAFPPSSNLELIANGDTVSLYLKEMACVPLLSAEQEVSLAQRIERGRQARSELLRLNGRLSTKRLGALETIIQDAQLAREELILANTRLVVSIARRYLGRGIPFLDLIQEGNLGLMRAVEKFDARRGFRFSTYATWWIRQSISRSIADHSRTIRMPVHMHDRLRQLYKAIQDLEQRLGRSPSLIELACELGIKANKLRWMVQVAQTPLSLDSPMIWELWSKIRMLLIRHSLFPSPCCESAWSRRSLHFRRAKRVFCACALDWVKSAPIPLKKSDRNSA
jgi:RNA polymerase primary sigma factor